MLLSSSVYLRCPIQHCFSKSTEAPRRAMGQGHQSYARIRCYHSSIGAAQLKISHGAIYVSSRSWKCASNRHPGESHCHLELHVRIPRQASPARANINLAPAVVESRLLLCRWKHGTKTRAMGVLAYACSSCHRAGSGDIGQVIDSDSSVQPRVDDRVIRC